MSDSNARPLASYRVIDMTRYLAGPIPGMILADMGAEVIKVETHSHPDALRGGRPVDPTKPPNEQHPQAHNVWRGKRSITLDIGQPEGLSILLDLVRASDVVIESFATGALERLGLGYDTLRTVRPDMILLSFRAYSGAGRLRGLRGGAPQIQAMTGINSMIGYAEGESLTLGRYSVDNFSGLNAFVALAAAMHQRDTEGKGQHIEVCLTKSAIAAFATSFLEYSCTGELPRLRGNYDPVLAPYNFFPCRGEDQWISIAVGDDEEWLGLCRGLRRPEWAEDERFNDRYGRVTNRDALEGLISQATREYDARELTETLQSHGVPAAPLMRAEDRLADAHFQARGLYSWVDHPVLGPEPLFNLGWKMSETPPAIRGPAPLLGEHNGWAFVELLGLSKHEVNSLTESAVLH